MSARLGYLLSPVDLLLLFLTYRVGFALRVSAISMGILTRSVPDPYPAIPHHLLLLIATQLLALWGAGLYQPSNWRFVRALPRAGAAFFGQMLILTTYTLWRQEQIWPVAWMPFVTLNATGVALLRTLALVLLGRHGQKIQPQEVASAAMKSVGTLEAVQILLDRVRGEERECTGWVSAIQKARQTNPREDVRTLAVCEEAYNGSRRTLALTRVELAREYRHLERLSRKWVRDLKQAEETLETERIKRSLVTVSSQSDNVYLQHEKELEGLKQDVHRAQEMTMLCLQTIGVGYFNSWPARLRAEVRIRFEGILFRGVRLPLVESYRVADFFLQDIARVFVVGFMLLLTICAGLLSGAPLTVGTVRWWAASGLWITNLGPFGNIILPSGKTLGQRFLSLKDAQYRNSLEAQQLISAPFQWLAEQIAYIAYLLLIIGVGIRLYQLVKEWDAPADEIDKS